MTGTIRGQYAGAVSRGVAFVLDMLVVGVVLAVSSWLATATLNLVGIDLTNCAPSAPWGEYALWVCDGARILLALYAALFAPVYAFFFWTFGGQTPGMGIMGIRVVRMDGKPISALTSVRRIFGFALCVLTLGAGFLLILLDDERQGLHDRIAGTSVIYAWRGAQDVQTIERVEQWVRRRTIASDKSLSLKE